MEIGDYDENTDSVRCVEVPGKAFPSKDREHTKTIRDKTLVLYCFYADYAKTRGITIAGMKLELGFNEAGEIVLADEMLTPDPS